MFSRGDCAIGVKKLCENAHGEMSILQKKSPNMRCKGRCEGIFSLMYEFEVNNGEKFICCSLIIHDTFDYRTLYSYSVRVCVCFKSLRAVTIHSFKSNFVWNIIFSYFEQAERDKDRKEKLKKFEDWQKVKKEKGEVRTTTTSTPFELMHDFAKLQKEH